MGYPYTPPIGDVDFEFRLYTPPIGDSVDFEFGKMEPEPPTDITFIEGRFVGKALRLPEGSRLRIGGK